MLPIEIKKLIQELSKGYGFLDVKIAKADALPEERIRLEQWLNEGKQGNMDFMEEHLDKRTDPRVLLPGTKSVLTFVFNYYPEEDSLSVGDGIRIAKYAYGKDYHRILKKRLKWIYFELRKLIPNLDGRFFVDSAPIMEREWAKRSGLGWVGKHTLIVHPKRGSFFFLSTMLLNIDLPPDDPISDYCGTCTKCIEACPTNAIDESGYYMDGSKCISYLTIELKDEKIPSEFKDQMEGWIFGCDICQDVCPWNKFSTPTRESRLKPNEDLLKLDSRGWENLTEEEYELIFAGSPIKRARFEVLKRNIQFVISDE